MLRLIVLRAGDGAQVGAAKSPDAGALRASSPYVRQIVEHAIGGRLDEEGFARLAGWADGDIRIVADQADDVPPPIVFDTPTGRIEVASDPTSAEVELLMRTRRHR
ncbi:hypothetical protein [Actinoallomurus iriomotensis]|uniref:Uncharacterized protein n=1 Tax=Actinoallomurus iriomotensis TaxID=478107 RepID=A0A9W6VUF0_9ACTN|nr:hypothetical protein [Actinoallomurus iriomotensis]GLY80079.1 hypothetical protein Airi01_083460 [Actinoallomurus iriomotensis]